MSVMRFPSGRIIIMAKAPLPGRVKTRLIPVLGARGAARLQRGLLRNQNADGGWAWNEWGTSSEVQHTALVVQALLAAGKSVTSTEVISAQTFIDSARNDDGGYAYQPGGPSDANTTSAVVQAQFAAPLSK